MRRSRFLTFVALSLAHVAMADQKIQCDQTTPDEYGFRERIFLQVNDANAIVSLRDRVFYEDGDNGFPGNLTQAFDPPLAPTRPGALRFVYRKTIAEDGGVPDTTIDVEMRFRNDFTGGASLVATYNDGLGGVTALELFCDRSRQP